MNQQPRNATPLGSNGHGAQSPVPDPRELYAPSAGDLRETLQQHEERVRAFAIAHPVPVLIGAFAIGYLLARVVMRGES
jgi:hypothetical protein